MEFRQLEFTRWVDNYTSQLQGIMKQLLFKFNISFEKISETCELIV